MAKLQRELLGENTCTKVTRSLQDLALEVSNLGRIHISSIVRTGTGSHHDRSRAFDVGNEEIAQTLLPSIATDARVEELNIDKFVVLETRRTHYMDEPKIYTTDEWRAKPPNRSGQPQKPAAGIIVHNTEHTNRPALEGEAERQAAFRIARSIQSDHLKRKDRSGRLWADTGQHFTVSRGGIIMEGRHGTLAAAKAGKVVSAAHANTTVHNQTWFGIELEGHYVVEFAMTDEQWSALAELSAWLAYWGKFDASNMLGHKQVSSTDCPGLVVNHMDELRDRVRERKEQIVRENG